MAAPLVAKPSTEPSPWTAGAASPCRFAVVVAVAIVGDCGCRREGGSSLGATLFSERGTATWTPLWKKLRKRKGAFCVWGSTGQNARMYICRCSDCGAIETAEYGKHEDEDEKQGARNKLAKFVLGRNAEDFLQG